MTNTKNFLKWSSEEDKMISLSQDGMLLFFAKPVNLSEALT